MRNSNRLLYILAALKIFIPYLLQNSVYELHRDEMLYLAEGHHLAWGFMEVPPVLSIFAWLTHVLGDSFFIVKLWPSLLGAATFFIAGKILLSLGGKTFAVILLFLPFVFGAYLRLFFLFQPNAPEVFFWTMIAFSFIRYVQTLQNKWLYLYGISVAIGMLSKYSVAFYAVSILAGILLTRHRTVFMNKHFWIASAIAFVVILPNIVWQYNASFPVIHHMKQLQETQLKYISSASFLIDQFIMNLPCFFICLAGLGYVLFSKERRFCFVGFAYVFVVFILLLGHGKSYYSLGAYPPLFAFGAYKLEQFTAIKRRALRYVFILLPVILGVVFVPIALPILPPEQLAHLYVKLYTEKTGALKWEDLKNHPLPQDFSDMLGWQEMAKKVAVTYHSLSEDEQRRTIIFCDNYGMAGAVNFYGAKYKLPQAYSDNASFLYWIPADINFKHLLLVADDPNELQHDFVKDFQSASVADSVTSFYAREKGDKIYLFKGANDNFKKYFSNKLAKDKAEFNY